MRDFSNFFRSTVADWVRCEVPDAEPDYVSFCGSAYWDQGDRVIRWSDHWGQLRTSRWFLEGRFIETMLCGECYYEDFRSIRTLDEE